MVRFPLLLAASGLVLFSGAVDAATWTVNSPDDLDDGECDASHCSLREALNSANADDSADTVNFAIPGDPPHVIKPQTQLPFLVHPVVIDGFSQPGANAGWDSPRVVMLDGSLVGDRARALDIRSSDVTIQGLAVGHWPGAGIVIDQGTHERITILGNFIGTTPDGMEAAPNEGVGIGIEGAFEPRDLIIGSADVPGGNLISGNAIGISVSGGAGFPVENTSIQNNRIGTDATGMNAIPNRGPGISTASCCLLIGGIEPSEGNIVSGNGGSGIAAWGFVEVYGNAIGANVAGDALGNDGDGVAFGDVGGLIGGLEPGMKNAIAHNGGAGIFVIGDSFAEILANSIHSNGGLGIDLGDTRGVNPNDALDADNHEFGPNEMQNWPQLDLAHANTIRGALHSEPNGRFWLDFYWSTGCDPSGHGEGEHYLGRFAVHTDDEGNGFFSNELPAPAPEGSFLTATATGADGTHRNARTTSEFSNCVAVQPAVPIPEWSAFPLTLLGLVVTASLLLWGRRG